MATLRTYAPHLGAIFILVAAFVLLYSPLLSAPFWAVDEWEVLQFSSPTVLHPQMEGFRHGMSSAADYAAYIANDFQSEGRFRPMWHISRFIGAALFGHNAAAWHASLLLMGSLTMILAYGAALAAGVTWLAALLIPLWMTVAGQANEVWWRIGPNEAVGMLLLMLAVFAAVKAAKKPRANRWDALMLAGLALAGLSKESFALTIPAVLFGRVALAMFWSGERLSMLLRQLGFVLALGLGGAFIMLAFTWLASQNGGWGTSAVNLGIQSFLPWNWAASLHALDPLMLYFLPAFLAFVIAPNLPNVRIASPWLLAGYAAFALWVGPQLILYNAANFTGRFLYPMLAGPAALNGWGVHVLLRRRLYWLAGPLLLIIALVLGWQAIGLHNQVGRLAAQASAFDDMLASAAQAADGRAIVIAADPARYPEEACAIPSLLGAKGVQTPLYFQPVYESGDAVAQNFMGYLARCFGGEAFVTSAGLSAAETGAVILLASREAFEAAPPAWYRAEDWQQVEHSRTFDTWRFNRSAPPVTVTFTTLEPGDS